MKSFVRMTKLSNIGGRADYISNPDRQEKILATSAPVDWRPYQEYEASHQKGDARNNEGRELIIALPNAWATLTAPELAVRVQSLAVTAVGKSTDLQWAVHWNKAHTNLHVHVIFSERQKENDPGRWDRDVYLTGDGKVARRKADRARLPDGSVAPPIHKKGELKDGFTAKDTCYKSRGWLHVQKAVVRAELEKLGAVIDKDQLLHEYHEGKGSDAPAIMAKNRVIRANNGQIESIRANYPNLTLKALKTLAVDAVKDDGVLWVGLIGQQLYSKVIPIKRFEKIQELKSLITAMDDNAESYTALRLQRDACGPFQRKKKKSLTDEMDAIAYQNQSIIRKAKEMGAEVPADPSSMAVVKAAIEQKIQLLTFPPAPAQEKQKPKLDFQMDKAREEIDRAQEHRSRSSDHQKLSRPDRSEERE